MYNILTGLTVNKVNDTRDSFLCSLSLIILYLYGWQSTGKNCMYSFTGRKIWVLFRAKSTKDNQGTLPISCVVGIRNNIVSNSKESDDDDVSLCLSVRLLSSCFPWQRSMVLNAFIFYIQGIFNWWPICLIQGIVFRRLFNERSE